MILEVEGIDEWLGREYRLKKKKRERELYLTSLEELHL